MQHLAATMLAAIPLHPDQASTIAREVDYLHFTLTGITLFLLGIFFGAKSATYSWNTPKVLCCMVSLH